MKKIASTKRLIGKVGNQKSRTAKNQKIHKASFLTLQASTLIEGNTIMF